MTADLRGFVYPLEALRRRREAELDAAEARLGRAHRDRRQAEEALRALERRYGAGLAELARASAARLDPRAHAQGLRWVAGLRAEVQAADARVAGLERRRRDAALECLRRRRDLDVVERDRAARAAEHAREREAAGAREADQEWLARREVVAGRRAGAGPAPWGGRR